jgi:hypothetical protein
MVGRGLDFLFTPELVMDRSIAYQIMSRAMQTGACFANKKTFSRYFHGTETDYVNARNMANPGTSREHKEEVARIAERFEKVLFAARVVPVGAAAR